MAAHTVPVEDLRKVGRLAKALQDYPFRSAWPLLVLRYFHLPKALRGITEALSGARTAELTAEETQDLYESLLALHEELEDVLRRLRGRRACRLLAYRWLNRLEEQVEDLTDVLETLAWGFDPDLQQFMDEAISKLERRPISQCQSG